MRVKGKSTVWLSRSWISNPAPEYVYFQASSADDRKVLFSTRTRLLESDPGNGEIALYMYTYSESEPESEGKLEFVTRVNTDHPDNRREEEGIVAGMSEDGTHVYFYTGSSTLVLPKRGEYLWDKGTIHFVAGVNEPISWLTTNIGGKPEELRRGSLARVSADGRRLAFQWVADRVNEAELAAPAPNEDTGVAEPGVRHEIRGGLGSGYGYTEDAVSYRALYVYDEASEKLNCVSCPPNGSPMTASVEIDANAVENDLQGGVGVFMPRFFSSDGKRLFFTSHDALVPQDTNGRADVYEYDVDTKEAKLLSSGTGGNGAWFEDASENGDDVFFLTAEKLLRGDTDTLSDLYDARVSGGFSEPLPPPPPCDGDACQGVPSAVPSFSTASGFTGLGNQHSSTVTQKSKQKKAKPKRRKHGKPRRHAKGRHARVAGRGAHRSSRVGR
jgi:hypothetical protein